MSWMISLREHLEGSGSQVPPPAIPPTRPESADQTLSPVVEYRHALNAFGEAAARATPGAGAEFFRSVREMDRELEAVPGVSEALRRRLEKELKVWSENALKIHNEHEHGIREIMSSIARAAEAVGQRDEKHGREIGELTTKLRKIAELDELAPIRRSIVETTAALKTCMEKMAEENRTAMGELSAQVDHYRTKLEEAEQSASLDPLTGLANRRSFEANLVRRIATGATFSLIMIDLNDFKIVNDKHGHIAGDNLLTQFAADLRAQFRTTDLVGRWGGDEFIVIVDGGITEAQLRAGRVRQWALGEYTLDAGSRRVKVNVSAGIGVVEWDKTESATNLIERADQKLYTGKAQSKQVTAKPVTALA